MVNILLRTSNRPKGFNRVIESLKKQTDQNFNLIVSVDNNETENYVIASGYKCKIKKHKWVQRKHPDHNPYNLYVNTLINEVKLGWYIVIDDDDIIHDNMVAAINTFCVNDDNVYIFKVGFIGKDIPSYSFGKSITFGDISSPCIVMNAKNKSIAKWKPIRGGDFHYINDIVESKKLNVQWVDVKYYTIQTPGGGRREDIK